MAASAIMLRLAVFVIIAQAALHGASPVPAFPGAEGAAMYTKGGRGGRVIAVTNLNDNGPGSLRAAVEAKGPRIAIFRVAGTIPLTRTLRIKNGDLTIAGQSAPGGGICLKNFGIDFSGSRNLILRHLRIRPGDGADAELDALSGRFCEDVIIDHCSASWSVDETVSIYECMRLTVQWCIISESLFKSSHHKGEHGYGGIWGGTEASWHHNLIAHHTSRNPRFARDERALDFRNNVIFNWGYNTIYGGEGSEVNVVGNFFRAGPATEKDCRSRILDASGKKSRWYLSENVVDNAPELDGDNWAGVHEPWSKDKKKVRAQKRFACGYVTTDTAVRAAELVFRRAGATLPERDRVDRRVIAEAASGSARFGKSYRGGGNGIIDHPSQVGGWPELRNGPAPRDTDGDGMPDRWEEEYALNAADPSDGPRDLDGDGYTNIEEFLNDTDPDKPDPLEP